jgi:NodT family efflux transporter outer membrane factor (OMF) lipoprotein
MPDKEKNQNILSQPSLKESALQALKDTHFALGDWPKGTWWEMFGSNELNEIVVEALGSNPSIQSIKERVEEAKQKAIISRSRLFPLLFFDADESWQWLSKNGLLHSLNPSLSRAPNLIDLSLSFTYEFDFWAKYRNLYQSALGKARADEAETKEKELIIATAVAQSFFALKTNLYRKDLYEELENVRKKTYVLQRLLQKKALTSKLIPSFAEERLEEARKQVSTIKQEIAVNEHVLNALRGKGADEPLNISNTLDEPPESMTIPKTLSIDLLSRRPDLMAAIWRVEALSHDVSAAIADFLPDINLKGLIGFESLGFSHLFAESSAAGGLFPAIHLPIFTAGAIKANVRSHKAIFNQAVYDYNDLLLRSTAEVADILSILESVYAKRKYQKTILECATFRLDLVSLNFKKGLDDLLQVYAREEEWIEKALEDAELIYSQYAASIKLIKALGGGYEKEK